MWRYLFPYIRGNENQRDNSLVRKVSKGIGCRLQAIEHTGVCCCFQRGEESVVSPSIFCTTPGSRTCAHFRHARLWDTDSFPLTQISLWSCCVAVYIYMRASSGHSKQVLLCPCASHLRALGPRPKKGSGKNWAISASKWRNIHLNLHW